jgi:hypothetical protein
MKRHFLSQAVCHCAGASRVWGERRTTLAQQPMHDPCHDLSGLHRCTPNGIQMQKWGCVDPMLSRSTKPRQNMLHQHVNPFHACASSSLCTCMPLTLVDIVHWHCHHATALAYKSSAINPNQCLKKTMPQVSVAAAPATPTHHCPCAPLPEQPTLAHTTAAAAPLLYRNIFGSTAVVNVCHALASHCHQLDTLTMCHWQRATQQRGACEKCWRTKQCYYLSLPDRPRPMPPAPAGLKPRAAAAISAAAFACCCVRN